MNLVEAFQSARDGNFVSHQCFDNKQSMHEYRSTLYYEDGANLTDGGGMEFLEREDWAKEGWYVKYPKDKVDKEKLKKMHDNNKSCMLKGNQTYEDCIIH